MRILIISALFPPNIIGGAEISAWHLAMLLVERGHDVGVLTTASTPSDVAEDLSEDGLRIWRVLMPRAYTVPQHGDQPKWRKAIWHLQDHFDPRNRKHFARVLDAFQPDFVSVQALVGLGFNGLIEVARRRLPTMLSLHDLVMVCLRSNMFVEGRNCSRRCAACVLSSWRKQTLLAKLSTLGVFSPSKANLKRVTQFVSFGNRPCLVLPNANRYTTLPPTATTSSKPALLFVGRIHPSKGIDVLLEAADRLAATHHFTLAIVGDGPSRASLQAKYGDRTWCQFVGFVEPDEVSNWMAQSDILCVPSVWAENLPGVVVNALFQGLAIVGSDTGGIVELVYHLENGLLVEAGDAFAWCSALASLIDAPEQIQSMKQSSLNRSQEFDPDKLGRQQIDFIVRIYEQSFNS